MVSRPWCLIVRSTLLSFVPESLKVTRVLPTFGGVTIEATPRPASATCPMCSTPSQRVHSSYRRSLHDLPWQGRPVTIEVATRRFHCGNRGCVRRTFRERLTGVARRSGRRTGRLRELQHHLGLALGGEAGARLAARIAVPTSPDTLLRLASARPNPETVATPRVLGIDDWAWKRGRRYGTVLVNLETNEVIDLLPDREAATVAAWLRDRPGVEIVARDRAGAYADGIRQGAPGAVQVAERWHLLRNLGEAVQALGDRHCAAARRAAQHVRAHLKVAQESAAIPVDHSKPPSMPTAAQQASAAPLARRQSQYEEAARLHSVGATISRIAAEIGVDRKTVRGWLRLGQAPLWQQPSSDSILDPFKSLLGRRWSEGCHNAAQALARTSRPRPPRRRFRGSRLGRRASWRVSAQRGRFERAATAGLADTERLSLGPAPDDEPIAVGRRGRIFITQLLDAEPALGVAVTWAKRLNKLLQRRAIDNLDEVLAAAAGTLFANFAVSLRRDFDAINAALVLPWTTSPVEGQISRIKMLKRTMYGRAGFELLRARVLNAA
jgi:transposase